MSRVEEFVRHQPLEEEVTAYDLVQAQENVKRSLDSITRRPHLDSEFLEREGTATLTGLALTAGRENLVEHGLGRDIRGWWVTDIRGPAWVWRVTSPSTNGGDDLSRFLVLGCSDDVTVTLVVF